MANQDLSFTNVYVLDKYIYDINIIYTANISFQKCMITKEIDKKYPIRPCSELPNTEIQ